MTDTRTTERLLEVIADEATSIVEAVDPPVLHAARIVQAILELRRGGDTLVRARDLELVVQAVHREQVLLGEDESQALARLDGALGGG
ncbi:MAG: hypothetical protein QOH15_1262 [Gaiellales bacterium]|nr:hypothetical protein [Gaiellales bacterium]